MASYPNMSAPRQHGSVESGPEPDRRSFAAPPGRRRSLWLVVLAAVVAAAAYVLAGRASNRAPATGPAAHSGGPAIPVVAVPARQGDVPVHLSGLGSVTASNTVTVKTRVDGQLTKVGFREGQLVREGDLLAEIDPRPFAAALAQAEGQLARDLAQLDNAKVSLERLRPLLGRGLIAHQQFDDQAATVGQLSGTVKLDRGLIDNARLQLGYCRITAPISGRVGLRLVDVGNMVHSADATGLLVITQVQPIAVLFAIGEDSLPPVLKKLGAGERLPVDAYDRSGRTKIAAGELLTVDNQIDPATGTSRLKAIFPNQDGALFPNQFVNVSLLLDVQKAATIVPSAAVQRGPQGTFAYVVKADQTVEVRPLSLGVTAGDQVQVTGGLSPDEVVVVDGVDKLRAGSKVEPQKPDRPTPERKPAA